MIRKMTSILFVLIAVATWIVSLEGSADAQRPSPYRAAQACGHDHNHGSHDHNHGGRDESGPNSTSGRTESNGRVPEGLRGGPPPLPFQPSQPSQPELGAEMSPRTGWYTRASADTRPSLGSSQFRSLCENCSREFQPRSNSKRYGELPVGHSLRNQPPNRFDERPCPYEARRQSDRSYDEFRGHQERPSSGFRGPYERTHQHGSNSQMSPNLYRHRHRQEYQHAGYYQEH